MTPSWIRDAVFYQIFPDRLAKGTTAAEVSRFQDWSATPNYFAFKGGTLWGVADDLERIKDLGCNALYFTPVFSSPANHRYHTHDYMQVDPILGGQPAFDHLLQKAHAMGMRVVLDGVFNHTGRSFFAFAHILENGLESPYLDWYEVNRDFLAHRGTLNAYPGPVQEKSQSGYHVFGYNAWWDLPALPKLNVHNPEVREYLLQVAEHWVRLGIDGWRLDVPTEISAPGFWEEFRTRVKAINPECYIVGEIWYEAPDYLRGDRFDGLMNYPLGTAAMAFFLRRLDRELAGRSAFRDLPELPDAQSFIGRVEHVLNYAGNEVRYAQLNLFTSHDTPRLQDLGTFEIQDCLQALAFLLCMPGAPCIYYGEEFGMHGGHDPLCRGTIPEDLRQTPPPFYHAVRDLVHLRNKTKALRHGDVHFDRLPNWPDRAFVVDRICADQGARIVVNGSSTPIPLSDTHTGWVTANQVRSTTLISGIKVTTHAGTHEGDRPMVLPSHSIAILDVHL
jgi:cyclomaltodextrinase